MNTTGLVEEGVVATELVGVGAISPRRSVVGPESGGTRDEVARRHWWLLPPRQEHPREVRPWAPQQLQDIFEVGEQWNLSPDSCNKWCLARVAALRIRDLQTDCVVDSGFY